jgi:hypothetical protein
MLVLRRATAMMLDPRTGALTTQGMGKVIGLALGALLVGGGALYASQRWEADRDGEELDVELIDPDCADVDSGDDEVEDEAVMDDDEAGDEDEGVEVEVTLTEGQELTVDDAYDDFVARDYATARTEAQRFTDASDASVRQRALRIVGAASCFLGDAAGARKAADGLDAGGRVFVRYVCGQSGLELP